jgi:hypothetical protein
MSDTLDEHVMPKRARSYGVRLRGRRKEEEEVAAAERQRYGK